MTHNIPDDITNYFNVEFFTAIAQNLDEPVPAISKGKPSKVGLLAAV